MKKSSTLNTHKVSRFGSFLVLVIGIINMIPLYTNDSGIVRKLYGSETERANYFVYMNAYEAYVYGHKTEYPLDESCRSGFFYSEYLNLQNELNQQNRA